MIHCLQKYQHIDAPTVESPHAPPWFLEKNQHLQHIVLISNLTDMYCISYAQFG
jgi:hypothetical protein